MEFFSSAVNTCKPLLSLLARALPCGAWLIFWKGMAQITPRRCAGCIRKQTQNTTIRDRQPTNGNVQTKEFAAADSVDEGFMADQVFCCSKCKASVWFIGTV